MQRFAGASFDSLDSYLLENVPPPAPNADQVRIRIAACALGYVDGLMVRGRYQIRPPLPYVPGGEIAGEVDAVGAGVRAIAVGDRVVTWQLGGGLAEQVLVAADSTDALAEGLSFSDAAAMLVDYQTAHYALFECARLRAGETVLVLGGAGGVGLAAIQMAAAAGAQVIATASSESKQQRVLAFGAQTAIDYSRTDWRDALKASVPGAVIDVVLDPVGGDAFEPAFRSLAKGGRYLVVGFAAGRIPSLPVNLALLKNATLLGVDIRHFLSTHPRRARAARQALFRLVASGRLRAPPRIEYPLAEARAAIDATLSRERMGKVVVIPSAGDR